MYPLLNHLDAPLRFLIFSIPEAMCLIVPFCLGIIYEQFWWGIFLSIVSYVAVRLCAKNLGMKYMRGFYYWHFPTRIKAYQYPITSFIREFVCVFLVMHLIGCSSVYSQMFDCPIKEAPPCQRLEQVYKNYMPCVVPPMHQKWYRIYNKDNPSIMEVA